MRHARLAAWLVGLALSPSFALAELDPGIGSDSVEALISACERFEHGDPVRALDLAAQAEALLADRPDPALLHQAIGCRAWALTSLSRTAEARLLLQPMAEIATQLDEPADQVSALRRKAALHHRTGNVAASAEHLGWALEIAERHDLRLLRIGLLTNMGVFHSEASQNDLALGYYYRPWNWPNLTMTRPSSCRFATTWA